MILPPLLKRGDSIAVISPGYLQKPELIFRFVQAWQEAGYNVTHLDNKSFAYHHPFSATKEDRYNLMQAAINSTEYKLIACLRGGFGLEHYLDSLDFSSLKKYPKWISGFSDITALHLALSAQNIGSLHGPMAGDSVHYNSVSTLIKSLESGEVDYEFDNTFMWEGKITGEVTGGNLTLCTTSIGCQNQLNANGKILFIEEVGEPLYRIDRMLNHLLRAGVAKGCLAVIAGHFSDIEERTYPNDLTVLLKNFANRLNAPLLTNFPAGHIQPNFPLFFGVHTELFGNKEKINFRQKTSENWEIKPLV